MRLPSLNAIQKPSKFVQCDVSSVHSSAQNTINYLFDQGMFIQETFIDKLSVDQPILVSNMVGNLVMQVIESITNIQVERDSSNLPAEDQVPPVLPHELLKLKGRNFTSIVVTFLILKQFWTDERISNLGSRHRKQHFPYGIFLIRKIRVRLIPN